MMCPICGSDGCSGAHYDYAFRGMATDFSCDADDKHHFLIIELSPTEYEDAETWLKEDSCEEGALDKMREQGGFIKVETMGPHSNDDNIPKHSKYESYFKEE